MTKKIEKEFCFTDDSVNVYGFRCLTSGLQLEEVKKNPIGFKMHNRENGVVVRWVDFRIDGDKVFAKPVINLSHPDGAQIVSEIENGFLNAASAGKIVCLEASDDIKLMLPGQTAATITKWFPREISLVDIPGNYNALANLMDKNNNAINISDLADISKAQNSEKGKFNLSPENYINLKLKPTAKESEINAAISLTCVKVVQAEKNAGALDVYINDFMDNAVSENRFTKPVSDSLKEKYKNNPLGLMEIVKTFGSQKLPDEYKGKSWDDLYRADKLEDVRKNYPELYEKLKNQKYPSH